MIGQALLPSLLGLMPDALKTHKIDCSLLMQARKAIMFECVGGYAPSVQLWGSLMSEVLTLERLRLCLDEKNIYFEKKLENVCPVICSKTM